MRRVITFMLAIACLLQGGLAAAQAVTGALIGTVKDAQGAVVPGAVVRVSSDALIGGPQELTTTEKGQLRFPALPPGAYVLDIVARGLGAYHEENIRIGVGATIERTVVLKVAGVEESLVVEGTGSRIEARESGFETRFGSEVLRAIPARRFSMFDAIRTAPGISPTSPASGSTNSVSAMGSGTNENTFLIDGTNFTCPCSGEARSEPGVDFIQEVHVQSVGASAEFGNMQGAVVNVITRQGGDRFLYDASYYGQTAGMTSQPVRLAYPDPGQPTSGYERVRYRDATTSLGGPVVRDRLWFFAGYQHLRDYDSQPGTDPTFPRTYQQDKVFAKLTWRLSPSLQLLQSFHNELWVNPELPTLVKPREATQRRHASVPAMTFGHLTHTVSPEHSLGRARRAVRVRPQGRPGDRQRYDAERIGALDERSERRAADVRRTDADSHDHQRNLESPPAWAVRCRSLVEDRRTGGKGRASFDRDHPDGCEVRLEQRTAVSVRIERSLHHRRCVHHGSRVRQRRHHGGECPHNQCGTAVRP